MIRSTNPFQDGPDWPADVSGQINHIIAKLFELDASAVMAQARMKEDLDLDSLDAVDIVIALERQFGFQVDEEVVTKLQTVGEIHAYVEAKLASRSS